MVSSQKATPLSVLDLPTQVTNILNGVQIFTVEDLMQYSREDLLNVKGLGPIRVNLIGEQLKNFLSDKKS